MERERADLSEHVFCTHFIGVVITEVRAAERAAVLFVRDGGEDEIAIERLF